MDGSTNKLANSAEKKLLCLLNVLRHVSKSIWNKP